MCLVTYPVLRRKNEGNWPVPSRVRDCLYDRWCALLYQGSSAGACHYRGHGLWHWRNHYVVLRLLRRAWHFRRWLAQKRKSRDSSRLFLFYTKYFLNSPLIRTPSSPTINASSSNSFICLSSLILSYLVSTAYTIYVFVPVYPPIASQ